VTTAPPGDATTETPQSPPRRPRRVLTLQARLMTAIIGMVAIILAIIALSTSAILSGVLQENLDADVSEASGQVGRALIAAQFPPNQNLGPVDILATGNQQLGTLLVLPDGTGVAQGAVTRENQIVALTDAQVREVARAIAAMPPGSTRTSVTITDLGVYRVSVSQISGFVQVVGLPYSEISSTLARMLTTIAFVTVGGLFLLASIIAIVIRIGLRPLRAVASTATRVAGQRMDSGDVSITERVPLEETDDRTEIGRVGAALNTLLEHVDQSLSARQRNEELMRSFVADASHELRTPLASIRGYSELSLRDRTLSETSAQALERIQAQSLRMTALVEDLLLLARLDEGQELVYGSVDLSRLAIEAVGDARPAGPDHRWTLDVGDEPVELAGDTARLHQVIANLLANARTHTPAGTEVTVSVLRDGSDAVLRVHDDGPGIDPAVAERLFERFARADRSRDRKTGGTGLGLSIAQAIVAAHGGTITVDSSPGDTTFEVRLPAKPAAPHES
jgi:two-component system, OmpR family, sensor kinase